MEALFYSSEVRPGSVPDHIQTLLFHSPICEDAKRSQKVSGCPLSPLLSLARKPLSEIRQNSKVTGAPTHLHSENWVLNHKSPCLVFS